MANTILLERISRAILAAPEQFSMEHWFGHPHASDLDKEFTMPASDFTQPNCGTTCCIAGWAIALAAPTTPILARYNLLTEPYLGIDEMAAHLLNIPLDDVKSLFFAENWPDSLQTRMYDAGQINDYDELAAIGAEAIALFITDQRAFRPFCDEDEGYDADEDNWEGFPRGDEDSQYNDGLPY